MKVKIRYFTTLRELAQRAEENLDLSEGTTLAELIEKIALKYGKEARAHLYSDEDEGKIAPSIRFLINGRDSKTLNGFKTKQGDGDVVAIIPPIGGGAVENL